MDHSTPDRTGIEDPLSLARAALDHGWSIIPVQLDKRPALRTWKEFQNRRPTNAEFEEWTRRKPAAWAVVTGTVSGVVVLDFDGEAGRNTLATLSLTPHVKTGSGGFHLYVKHPGRPVSTLNGKTKRDLGSRLPGMDIRADGGFAVFSGRNAAGGYEWLDAFPPKTLAVEMLPWELQRYLGLVAPNGTASVITPPQATKADHLVTAALRRVGEHGRNEAGFWLACQLRDAGFPQSEATGAMHSYCSQVPSTDAKGHQAVYTWAEASASLDQAYSRPARAPLGNLEPPLSLPQPPQSEQQDATRIAPGFLLNDQGVFKTVEGNAPTWICAPVHVVAHARTADKEEWGKLLRFSDPEGCTHQWVLPMSLLAKDPGEFRGKLLSLGLKISAARAVPDFLRQYLQMSEPGKYALTVDRIGWHGDTFVLPEENIGPSGGEMILFQAAREMGHNLRANGTTLEQWRRQVSRYCSGNSRLLFCVSCAGAAPLLHFLGEQSGGFHFVADTTVGKTTCLMVAGSFWGGGGQNGFVQSWLTTANGLEKTAEWHNNVLLCLDELKLIDPEQASRVAYSLSNGQSKGRMGRDISAHRRVEWLLLFLSSGEIGLAAHLEAASQRRLYGGQEVRFCEIPARVDDIGGAFESLHEFETPKAFADHLKAASRAYYGSACREYIRQLSRMGCDSVRSAVEQHRKRFTEKFIPAGASPEVARAGARFSLVAAAGELLTGLGITGWQPGEAQRAAGVCFAAWRNQRGGNGAWDEDQALKYVKGFLVAHGNSRFQLIEDRPVQDVAKIPNRIGFRSRTRDGECEYIVLSDMFRELCGPYAEELVRRVLQKRGLLKGADPGHATVKRMLPELGRPRCYVISETIFSEGEDEDKK